MKEKAILLQELSDLSLDVYELEQKIDETATLEFKCFEDFKMFLTKHGVDSVFYYYDYINQEVLLITDDVIRGMGISEDEISVVKNEIELYNAKVNELDFGKPFELCVVFIFEGQMYVINEYDYWFIELGFGLPQEQVKKIMADNKQKIDNQKRVIKEEIDQKRNELREKILSDPEFHQCTNGKLRTAYAKRLFQGSQYTELFCKKGGGFYDLPAQYFIEEVWREHKRRIKGL